MRDPVIARTAVRPSPTHPDLATPNRWVGIVSRLIGWLADVLSAGLARPTLPGPMRWDLVAYQGQTRIRLDCDVRRTMVLVYLNGRLLPAVACCAVDDDILAVTAAPLRAGDEMTILGFPAITA